MQFSVCIDALYSGRDFLEGMRETRAAGYDAYEFWSWWDKDLAAIAAEAQRLGLRAAAMCTRFIPLTDPSCREAYLAGLSESIAAAARLGCTTLISQTGPDTGAARDAQRESVEEGLRRSAPLLEKSGVTLVVEPLNTKIDHPGYFLTRAQEAFDIVERVGSPAVRVLYDIYHQQITEGDVVRAASSHIDRIGHLHAAGNPGRHELDDGELQYAYIFKKLDEAGYTGWCGLEYFPARDPREGLVRLKNREEIKFG